MVIHLSGNRAGSFTDFANSEDKGGTPLYLWQKATGKTYPEAIAAAKDFLGIRNEDHGLNKHKPEKVYEKLKKPPCQKIEPNGDAMDYLTITRKICPIVIAENKIAESKDGEVIIFPYFDESGEPCHVKHLKVKRIDGKKEMWASAGTKRCLYGIQTIDQNCRSVVICEGEIDKLSWQTLGVSAVSVPMGVLDTEWIEINWTWLERFESIYLSMDMDGPGAEATQRLAKRLGIHRCYIVKLPKKDINECLCSGFTRDEAKDAIASAKPIEIPEIQTPIQYADEVWNLFQREDSGYTTPWFPQIPWRIRPSELTLVSGYDNSGKSCGLSHLVVDLRNQGAKVLVFSFEIAPSRTLQWMTRQSLSTSAPKTREELSKALTWLTEGIWMYDYVGTADIKKMFEAMDYAVRRFGIDIVVIDSLFKCGISSEDYNAQKEFISQHTDFCKLTGTHTFLVCHARKPPTVQKGRNDDRVPTRDEISGTSDIKNGGFNVLVFWRNMSKHNRIQELQGSAVMNGDTLKAIHELELKPDGRIRLDKQRFGNGRLGEIPTWYDTASTQLKTSQADKPKVYLQ
jgi:twinkle protein